MSKSTKQKSIFDCAAEHLALHCMHTLQVTLRQIGSCQRRSVQLGIAEGGSFEVGASQVCAAQVCIGQVGTAEVDTFQVPATEVPACASTSRSKGETLKRVCTRTAILQLSRTSQVWCWCTTLHAHLAGYIETNWLVSASLCPAWH